MLHFNLFRDGLAYPPPSCKYAGFEPPRRHPLLLDLRNVVARSRTGRAAGEREAAYVAHYVKMDLPAINAALQRGFYKRRPQLPAADIPRRKLEFGRHQHVVAVTVPTPEPQIRRVLPEPIWPIKANIRRFQR